MTRRPKAIVLDSWSVMAYLEDEPAGQRISEIIVDAQESETPLMMTVVNIGEIWYLIARKTSEKEADQTVSELKHLGIHFIEADWKLTREAARFKSHYRMSFADCFASALAKDRGADLLTGDLEFKQVETEVKILWLP